MKMIIFLLLAFWLPVTAADIPNNYNGLAFGAGAEKLKSLYPPSEGYRCTLSYSENESEDSIDVYRLVYKKGYVDSVKLYFFRNHFAMAVEYCYPGADIRDKAFKNVSGRYGPFIGRGEFFWKKQNDYLIMFGYTESTKTATITFRDVPLSDKISAQANYFRSDEELEIDRNLKKLKGELDSLKKADQAKGKKKKK